MAKSIDDKIKEGGFDQAVRGLTREAMVRELRRMATSIAGGGGENPSSKKEYSSEITIYADRESKGNEFPIYTIAYKNFK